MSIDNQTSTDQNSISNMKDRRKFLIATLYAIGANVSIYAIGSSFRDLDGGMVAGAKTWQPTGGTEPVICPGTTWGLPRRVTGSPCTTLGDFGYGFPMCGPAVAEMECVP